MQSDCPFDHSTKLVATYIRAFRFRGGNDHMRSFGLNDFQRLPRLLDRDHLIAVLLQEFLQGVAQAGVRFHDENTNLTGEGRCGLPEHERFFRLVREKLYGHLVDRKSVV